MCTSTLSLPQRSCAPEGVLRKLISLLGAFFDRLMGSLMDIEVRLLTYKTVWCESLA